MKEEAFAFPTSFSQRRLWFLEQLSPGRAVYNIPRALRFKGPLNLGVLERSLNEIVRRHEVLRTTFASVEGEPVQIVSPQVTVQFPIEDMRHIPESQREETAVQRISEEARRPFDLASDPLLRTLLLQLDENDNIFSITMHHIISDAWSLSIFQREMAVLYEAFLYGHASPLEELAIQYIDYTIWQHKWLQGKVLEEELAYWKGRLANVPTLQLPTDRPRPLIKSDKGAWEFLKLGKPLTDSLIAFGRGEDVTLFMVLLTAFKIFLYRYTGQHDIIVGSPIANRNQVEIEPLIGFFVNMLALRTDLSGDPQFRRLLQHVGEMSHIAYDHQYIPFEKLVAELQPERNMSHSPLFQVAFVLQNTPHEVLEITGLTVSSFPLSTDTAKFDLMLSLIEQPAGLCGKMEYNTDLFDRSTIIRMLGNFQTLLQGIIANPDCRISQFPLLTKGEAQQVLKKWNATQTDYPQKACVHKLFEAQATRTPDAIAVIFENQQMTYRQLNEAANDLAKQLRILGVGPDVPVGIMMDRSLEMTLAVLGIFKAGGAYVPLDPTYPDERLLFILRDTQTKVLLTQRNLSDVSDSFEHQVLYLDGRASHPTMQEKCNPDNPNNNTSLQHAAYMIYTSGSTGIPKGIIMNHGALCNLINWQLENTKINPKARTLQFASLGFDVSFQEMFSTWCAGGTLVLIPESLRRDIQGLLRFIDRMSVERIFVPFVVLQHLAEIAVSHKLIPSHLHEIITAGEQLQITPSIRKMIRRLEHYTLHNQYGPSETHVVTSYTLVGDPESWPKLPPIGRPISNARIYILDQNRNPQPIGIPGELYIGGRCLSSGYLNRPELNDEKFVKDPFNPMPGTRLYRTGDLARYLPDGNIEFLGRMDTQVKLRGFRIELGEIESVLSAHDSVREAVVLLREDEPGEKRLVGYVTPREDVSLSVEDLRSYLKHKLPDYMVPSCFVQLESLPLTRNGKIDRHALPVPDTYQTDLSGQLAGPRTPMEQALVEIWSDVLGRSGASGGNGIGIHDNFFHLGGHSLLATQVISRVNETFGVSIPVAALFEHPTPGEFAEELESKIRHEVLQQEPKIKPAERKEEMPLSFAQQRLWFISQLEPDSPFYNIPIAIELKGELNQEALQKSLNEMIRRHESLRSRFRMSDGQPVQLIDAPWQMDIPVTDLGKIPDLEQQEETHNIINKESLQPFDLVNGPLLRAKLIRITEADHILVLTMHHIVSDGWSMGVLFHELAVLYESYTKDRPSTLPELPVQYADFAVWQRQWLSGEVLDSQLSYWREQLSSEISILNLPTDYPRPAIQTFNGARHSIQLSKELTESIKELSRSEHVTLFMTLLSAFKVLLYRYTGQDDIIVGSPIANRNRTEIEGLIGIFVNMLVLRSQVSDTQSFLDLLAQVRKTTLGAYMHQDLPFEKLVDEFVQDRDLSRSQLFQVSFALQNAPMKPLELVGLQLEQIKTGSQTTRFEFEVHAWEQNGQLKIIFIYNNDLFAPSTIERMMNHYQVLLQGIVSNPECRISDLSLMSQPERQELLEVWGKTQTDYPRDACIHELFESQAQKNPDAVAIIFKDQQLTYSQLNERANKLAHHLRSLGINRGSPVAVCLERSIEMVVSMLGILKAGGAYVPLDLGYPAQRLSFMLQDTESNVLLTREDLPNRFSEEGVQVVCLDRDKDLINTQPVSDPETEACGDDLAYVMYTSGSTGTPKGVEVLHRGIVRLVCNTDYIQLGEADRVGHISNCSFDASTFEVWGSLLSGARLVVLDHETVLSPRVLADSLKSEEINVLFLTTALFNLLAKESPQVLAGIGHLLFGGEAVDPQWVRKVLDEKGIGRLLHVYGPTENTTFTTWYEVNSVPDEAVTVPIGHPIANTRVYVLDNNMKPVPVGVPGELYIGGDGLARDYLNRPDLTAERFVDDPFTEGPGSRLYRTGDTVRWLPEGVLEFLGRKDDLVKLRGFRIELGEIESVLSAHESVGEAVVLLREDEPGDKRLVGYIVPGERGPVSLDDLRAYLKKRLPDYMVPSYFVQLDSLPLTPNGKVDKRALPVPERSLTDREEDYAAPTTPMEKELAEIWQEVLGIDHVSVYDNFFDLGGHSLMSVEVVSKLEKKIGLRINPMELMLQNLGQVAAVCEKKLEESPKSKMQQKEMNILKTLKKMFKGGN